MSGGKVVFGSGALHVCVGGQGEVVWVRERYGGGKWSGVWGDRCYGLWVWGTEVWLSLLCAVGLLVQYVPKELLEVYRDELIPLADIVTPNDFEAR